MKSLLPALFCCLPANLAAQSVTIRGLAFDSLHNRPLAAAFVTIEGSDKSAFSDSTGAFVIAGVKPGAMRLLMQHEELDHLGIPAAGARVVVTDGRQPVTVAVPSFGTLWRAACGSPPPTSPDSGVVFGTLILPEGSKHAAATVTASWVDLAIDSARTVRQTQMNMEVDADSAGRFTLCGVPTNLGLTFAASMGDSLKAPPSDIDPLDKERIARIDLILRRYDD
jgi:hypothetical protein